MAGERAYKRIKHVSCTRSHRCRCHVRQRVTGARGVRNAAGLIRSRYNSAGEVRQARDTPCGARGPSMDSRGGGRRGGSGRERGCVRGQLELEEEAGSPPGSRLEPERGALRLHQLAADGESEAGDREAVLAAPRVPALRSDMSTLSI